jgi:hypothetical protein
MTFFTTIGANVVLVLAMHLPFAFIFLDDHLSWSCKVLVLHVGAWTNFMTLLLASIAPPIASLWSFFEAHRYIVRANNMSINFLTLSLAHALLGKLGICGGTARIIPT